MDVNGLSMLDLLRIALAVAGILLSVLAGRMAHWAHTANAHNSADPFRRTPFCWALSYAIFATYTAADLLSRLGEPVSWRAPLYAAAVLSGWYAVYHLRRMAQEVERAEAARRTKA